MGGLMESLPGRVIRKFLEDQAPNWAAMIAWNALFAMFPIVIFAASILGYALRLFGQANDAVYKTIFTAIPGDPKQQDELLKAVSGVKSQSGILLFVGLAGLLLGGSALFGVMEQAFAVIYHTKPRDFVRQKLIAFGMVFLFTLLVGVAVARDVRGLTQLSGTVVAGGRVLQVTGSELGQLSSVPFVGDQLGAVSRQLNDVADQVIAVTDRYRGFVLSSSVTSSTDQGSGG